MERKKLEGFFCASWLLPTLSLSGPVSLIALDIPAPAKDGEFFVKERDNRPVTSFPLGGLFTHIGFAAFSTSKPPLTDLETELWEKR